MKDFVFWGLIKYGTTKDFVENEEVKNGKTEVSSSSITGTDPLGQGTVIKVNNNAKEYGVTTKDYNNPDESTYTPVVENKKYSGVSGKIFGYGNCTYTGLKPRCIPPAVPIRLRAISRLMLAL